MRGEGDMFRTDGQTANVTHTGESTRTEGGNGVAGDGATTGADATLVELLRKEVDSLQEQVRNKDSQIAALLAIMSK